MEDLRYKIREKGMMVKRVTKMTKKEWKNEEKRCWCKGKKDKREYICLVFVLCLLSIVYISKDDGVL